MLDSSWKLGKVKLQAESLEFVGGSFIFDGWLVIAEDSLNEFLRSAIKSPFHFDLCFQQDRVRMQIRLPYLKVNLGFHLFAWERGIAFEVTEIVLLDLIPLRGIVLSLLERAFSECFKISPLKREGHSYFLDLLSLIPWLKETCISEVQIQGEELSLRFSKKKEGEGT